MYIKNTWRKSSFAASTLRGVYGGYQHAKLATWVPIACFNFFVCCKFCRFIIAGKACTLFVFWRRHDHGLSTHQHKLSLKTVIILFFIPIPQKCNAVPSNRRGGFRAWNFCAFCCYYCCCFRIPPNYRIECTPFYI
jgi:hypothetical protein